MSHKHDWRLQGQEKYLKGKVLFFEEYRILNKEWDHDHCEFCSIKFSEEMNSDAVTKGYTTEDHYRWICESCFNDFRELFEWKIGKKEGNFGDVE